MGSNDTQFDPTEANPYRAKTDDNGVTIIYDIQGEPSAWIEGAAVDLRDVA